MSNAHRRHSETRGILEAGKLIHIILLFFHIPSFQAIKLHPNHVLERCVDQLGSTYLQRQSVSGLRASRRHLGLSERCLGRVLVAFWKHLGSSSKRLGSILSVLGAPWGVLGSSWRHLKASWGVLGASWRLGGILRRQANINSKNYNFTS